jgi:glycerol-3-phosphate acyltransferase PlsY
VNIFILFLAYLLGSIPFGLIIGKIVLNKDVREQGSGSIGATNVTRMLGKKWGMLVVLLDGFKAAIPILTAKILNFDELTIALTTLFAILGHIFPIWLKFRGGKGIASLIFSLFVLDYKIGVIFIISWGLIYLISHTSALSALIATTIVVFFSFFIMSKIYFILLCVLGVLIFYRHKDNIKRMINGEELKFKK